MTVAGVRDVPQGVHGVPGVRRWGPPEPHPLRFPDQLTQCHRLPIKVIRPVEQIHHCNLEVNLELMRQNFREVVNFDYWNPDARKAPFWVPGFLPSVYLASLAYTREFRLAMVSTERCPLEQLMWPCGGILGMDCSLAVGPPNYCKTDEECRGIASLFAKCQMCQMTDPNETWYVQGKFQFLIVLQRQRDGTIRPLKVCRFDCEDGFQISCVQRKNWNIHRVVETMGTDGRQLPVIVDCIDRHGGANFFHCAWLPTKLINDFRATMEGKKRDDDGWVPPAHVNPKLYDVNGEYIPVCTRCFGRTK